MHINLGLAQLERLGPGRYETKHRGIGVQILLQENGRWLGVVSNSADKLFENYAGTVSEALYRVQSWIQRSDVKDLFYPEA